MNLHIKKNYKILSCFKQTQPIFIVKKMQIKQEKQLEKRAMCKI